MGSDHQGTGLPGSTKMFSGSDVCGKSCLWCGEINVHGNANRSDILWPGKRVVLGTEDSGPREQLWATEQCIVMHMPEKIEKKMSVVKKEN